MLSTLLHIIMSCTAETVMHGEIPMLHTTCPSRITAAQHVLYAVVFVVWIAVQAAVIALAIVPGDVENLKNGYRTALGGLLSAFSVAIMLFGSILPFSTYVVPVVSSLPVVYFCIEYSKKHAFLVYMVIAILCLAFVPDKETSFIFAFIFGPYPILKSVFENIRSRLTGWILKIVSFNIEVLLTYFVLLKLLSSAALVAEFMSYTSVMLIFVLLLGNVTFIIYDIALTRLIALYIKRLRPHLMKKR